MKPGKSLAAVSCLFQETFMAWFNGNPFRLGAALAYYTVFSIAPLFLIALTIASFWFGEEAAQRELFGQVSQLMGKEGGEAIQSIVSAAGKKPNTGVWAGVVAGVMLFIGASGVFVELQSALNTIWNVKRNPQTGVKSWLRFLRDRFLSFGMVLGVGFLLLVSLILSAAISAVGSYFHAASADSMFWQVVNSGLSFVIIAVLFAMLFKILPDARVGWRDVMAGGFLASLLFSVGKYLLGLYLGKTSLASAYGAAGSLVVVLVWVYYSTQILFFGAEFTRTYAEHYGGKLKPVPGASIEGPKEDPKKRTRRLAKAKMQRE